MGARVFKPLLGPAVTGLLLGASVADADAPEASLPLGQVVECRGDSQ
jgi:hypothetical protein